MKKQLILLLVINILVSSCKDKNNAVIENQKSILKGEVIDRESEFILMAKATEDLRQEDKVTRIPISNGTFEFEFEPDEMEAYQLVFEEEHLDGGWITIIFFPERGLTTFKLHSTDSFNKNVISNNGLNKVLNEYKMGYANKFDKQNKEFFKENDRLGYDNLYSESYNLIQKELNEAITQEDRVKLYDKINKLKENKLHRSELGKKRDSEYALITNEYFNSKYEYILNNPTLVAYSFLIEDLMFRDINMIGQERVRSTFEKLKNKYPGHSYTQLGLNLMVALNELKVGGSYINFSAPDVNGNIVELSNVLKENKVVLLDLWATWCGPCIAKTRLAKPIYEKYKEKGFTILGVAGERQNLTAYNKFMSKEKWPWQQLLEIGGKNRIWEKYGISNAGGAMFLIDSTGEILAVDPNPEELGSILKERL